MKTNKNNHKVKFKKYTDKDRYYYRRLSNWGSDDEEKEWSDDYSNSSWFNEEVLTKGKLK